MILAAPLLAAALLMIREQPVEFRRWGRIEARLFSGRALGRETIIDVAAADARHGGYLLARKVEFPRSDGRTTVWADSRRCAALAAMPASLSQMKMPEVGQEQSIARTLPDGRAEIAVSADGPDYLIDAPGRYVWPDGARVLLQAGSGPIARWVQSTLASFETCWSATTPKDVFDDRRFGRWVWRSSED